MPGVLKLWPEPVGSRAWAGDATDLKALAEDVDALLSACGREVIREHVPRATGEARRLARQFGVSETARYLGGLVPRNRMVPLCESLGVRVLPEERQVPLLLHAQLSAVLARERYGVTDGTVVQAIRFHTTLHASPTALDLVVFLADKLE